MTKKNTLVSVLHWNNDTSTNNCIKSFSKIDKNDRPDILVVDNGSVVTFAGNDEQNKNIDVHLLRSNTNLGFGGGHNLGIKYAIEKGYEYVVLLNNDTLVKSADIFNELEKTLKKFDALASAPKIINSDGSIWFGGGKINNLTNKTEHVLDESIAETTQLQFLSGCCLMIDLTKTVEANILFDTDYFMYWEDNDWCFRQQKSGFKLVYDPGVSITHNVSGSLGVASPTYVYYIIRNHILFIKKNLHSYHKLLAYGGVIIEKLKYLISILLHKNRIHRFKALYWGLIDGFTNKSGKLDRIL